MDGISRIENSYIADQQYHENKELGAVSKNKAQQLPLDDNIKFENAFNKAKEFVEINDTRLSLSYDKENREPVIYVVDGETNEVIRRIPPEKLIEISGDEEKMKGLFFQKDV